VTSDLEETQQQQKKTIIAGYENTVFENVAFPFHSLSGGSASPSLSTSIIGNVT
jgi:hypothetical protein